MRGIIVLMIMVSVFTAGCAANRNNQAKQQGVKTQQTQNQTQGNVDTRIQIASEAAAKISTLNEVSSANVLVTQNNAYVAVTLGTNQQLTPELENKIAQQVKATDPNIKNVYVSTNPDFVQHVNRYVSDVQQGRPVSGFFQEFSDMIGRVFPKAR